MLSLSQDIAIANAWVLFIVSPGPSFACTVRYATAQSRWAGMCVAMGVVSAMGVWLLGSLLGFSALFIHFRLLIKLLGSCSLVVLGIQTLRSANTQVSEQRSTFRSTWLSGFLTTMGNPKAVVFFSSLFVLFLPPGLSGWMQGTIVTLLLLFASAWYGLVACLFSWSPIGRAYHRVKRWVDCCLGGCFVALGLMLLER